MKCNINYSHTIKIYHFLVIDLLIYDIRHSFNIFIDLNIKTNMSNNCSDKIPNEEDFKICFICAREYDSSFKKRLVEGIPHPLYTCESCYDTMMVYFIQLAVAPPRIFFVQSNSKFKSKIKSGRYYFTNIDDFKKWCSKYIISNKKYDYGITMSSEPVKKELLEKYIRDGDTSSIKMFWSYEENDDDDDDDIFDWKTIVHAYENFDTDYCFMSSNDESFVYSLNLPDLYEFVQKKHSDAITRHQKALKLTLTEFLVAKDDSVNDI